jgi:hypothetical protein
LTAGRLPALVGHALACRRRPEGVTLITSAPGVYEIDWAGAEEVSVVRRSAVRFRPAMNSVLPDPQRCQLRLNRALSSGRSWEAGEVLDNQG